MTAEQRLNQHGINVRPKPLWDGTPTTDEQDLCDLLQEVVGYRSENTRERDLKTILAVHQIRRGEEPRRFEDAPAIFVTSNRHVAHAAGRHFRTDRSAQSVPVVVTVQEFATLLWLKSPTERPDLPWRRLLADCRAAVRPSDALWTHYLDEVDRLRDEGSIDAETYLLARYSYEARRALMERTKGVDKNVSTDTVAAALQDAKAEVARPAVADAHARREEAEERARLAQARVKEAQAEIEQVKSQEYDRGVEIGRQEGDEAASERIARGLARGIGGTVAILVFLAWIALQGVNVFEFAFARWVDVTISVVLFLIAAVFTLIAAFGGSVRDRVSDWLQPRVRRWMGRGQ